MFHSVPDGRPSGDRVHLTCWPPVVADADRLKSLGAKQIRSPAENNNRWISFADPVGTSLTSSPADPSPNKSMEAQK